MQNASTIGNSTSIAAERSHYRAELRNPAETYKSLLENLNDVVFSIDLSGRFSYISPSVERFPGFKPHEIIGRPFEEFVHHDDLNILRKSFEETLAGDLSPLEFRVIAKDGSVHWCRTSSRPQMTAGEVTGVTGVMLDITEGRRTHEALRKAEEKYRTIFEQAVVGIFQTDAGGRYVTANPALAKMFGYDSPDEFMTSIKDIARDIYVTPERRKEFIQLAEEQETVNNFEVEVYRKDGSTMWVSANARAIREHGRVSFEGFIEDITQRRLIDEQLLHAQKMEALGHLAGGIAHDFNNLLGVILGHGELLLKQLPVSDPSRRRLKQICHAGKRAASLSAQLLTFSRQQVSQVQVLDLNVIVREAKDLIEQIIGDNIELLVPLSSTPNWVKADAGQIEQILLNLAVNSRDAMPDGGRLTVNVKTFEVDQSHAGSHPGVKVGAYSVLTVMDTGVGMSEKTMVNIFEPFFTTKPMGKGTGLGLASTYGIVKQSGGYISVSSELGSGTTFEIYLPLFKEQLEAVAQTQDLPLPARTREAVLVVEDRSGLRQITREFVEELGYAVVEADGGEEALRIANSYDGPIPLMITDVVMRDMSGGTLAERMKSLRAETKVLYVSGYADKALLRCGVNPYEVNFLQKPYSQLDLAKKIHQLLPSA